MSIIYADNEISSAKIDCGEVFQVRLSLAALPGEEGRPGASDIVIRDTLSPGFRITSLAPPTKGQAVLLDSHLVEWEIAALGIDEEEGASLTFTVIYEGTDTGLMEVTQSIFYCDLEGNPVTFPSPSIQIDCGTIEIEEGCPEPMDIVIGDCSNTIKFDAGELMMDSLGRILQLDVTLLGVCPGKRVALAVILNEVDEFGIEYQRGMKTMTIPAHNRSTCQDITIRCVEFVLPQDLDVSSGCSCLCNKRNLRVRLIAHYVDHGYICCHTANS